MTDGVSSFLTLRGRGQSETLGVVLLTAIVVILVALIGGFLFAELGSSEEQVLANIQGEVTSEGVVLTHEGGDSFGPGELTVLLRGDAEEEWSIDNSFEGGDKWESGDSLSNGEYQLLVVHESSNTMLLNERFEVE